MTNYYSHGTVEVTTSVTLVATIPFGTPSDEPSEIGVLIKNNGPVSVFLGGVGTILVDGESALSGFELEPGEKVLVPGSGSNQYTLQAVTASGTAYVSYLGA
jgi:hypothetical protein